MDPILEQFLQEARDNLSFLDRNLEELKGGDEEIMNALFRAAHTLKGGAGLVGLDSVKNIVHHAEDLLDGIRKGNIEFQEEMLDALYDAFDEVVEIIDATEESGEIPEIDEENIKALSDEIAKFLNKNDDNKENVLDTNLNIAEKEYPVGPLLPEFCIEKFANNIPFDFINLDNSFLEEENYYLLDFDLEDDTCYLGNDPAYFIYLLGEENIIFINTIVYSCKEDDKFKTRFIVITKNTQDIIEEAIYNVIDEVSVYPLSIKSLFNNDFDSAKNEIFDDFLNDFKNMLENSNFKELSEKLSAIVKVLNLDSYEGFVLQRFQTIINCFEFESVDYLESIKYVSSLIVGEESLNIDSKEDDTDEQSIKSDEIATQENIQIEQPKPLDEKEKETLINAIKAQIKVLNLAKDEMAISRVRLQLKSLFEFANLDISFNVDDTKEIILEKLNSALSSLGEKGQTKEEKTQNTQIQKDTNIKQVVADKDNKSKEIKKEKTTTKPKANHSQNQVPKTVKIDQEQIDNLMDIIGELLVVKNALPYVAKNIKANNIDKSKSELISKYDEINRLTEQLQDVVMGMRLLPLSYIFSRYPKLVRDISKKLGKKIDYEEFGAETKLDKAVIEKIADPLVHIIRNSLDHGIELPDERVSQGKSEHGKLIIGAKAFGDKVHIIIEDDGRGIDTQKVVFKALSLGIVNEEQLNSMTEEDKNMLIFHPGLSTAEKVTELSGRGVGTDAVMSIVNELGGKIYLDSKQHIGTKTTIELPLSVALTNVFCVKMGDNNYAIPMESVVETIKIKKEDMQIANNKPYVRVRGNIIPLVFDNRLIDYDFKSANGNINIVLVQGIDIRFGLVVDEFVNQLDVVQKPLDGVLANHPIISGTSLLGNGEVLFVLDINKIIKIN